MSDNDKKPTSNVLKIGISELDSLEEKVRAFININLTAKNKRFIISREEVLDKDGKILLNKGEDIDFPKVKLLKRIFKEKTIKTFQPDEGVVIISDMSSPGGIQLSMDLVTQIMNIGGGAYEAFIDRVDSFKEMSGFLKKSLFPKLAVIGFIPEARQKEEMLIYSAIRRADPYMRFLEVTQPNVKPNPVFPALKQVYISPSDKESWKRFILEIIAEYTKPYNIEER